MIVKISPSSMYTFKFEAELKDDAIDFVDVANTGANTYLKVLATLSGHAGVLQFYDVAHGELAHLEHTGFDINTTGAIELLWRETHSGGAAATCDFEIDLKDGATQLIKFIFSFDDNKLYYNRGAGEVEIGAVAYAEWHYLSIRIDVGAGVNGQFDCYLFDEDYSEIANVTGIEFQNNATTIDEVHIGTEADNAGIFYINCVGITAEGGYTQGDIQYAEIDVSSYISSIMIDDGIIPFEKKCIFHCSPDYHTYFEIGDFIDVFDDSDNLRFAGIIIDKSRNSAGIYVIECDGMGNEFYDRTYDKSYSGDDTDTKQKDIIDNGLKFCHRDSSIVGTTLTYDYEYNRACAYQFELARFLEMQVCAIYPDGKVVTEAHNALTATGKSWTLNDGNQDVILTDIKGFEEDLIPGYYKGNTGITSVSVRYKDNTPVVRPASPSETFRMKRLNEYRDPKIQELATAQQLGDNLFSIFSADTIFLGLRVEGEGWLQPGQTIQIQATDQVAITQDDFLILRVRYDPQNDIYEEMILTDNIIFPSEFLSGLDTTQQQIHTAVLQSCENQENLTYAVGNYIHLQDQKAAGIAGGAFTAGAWRTRVLNVEVTDQPSACTLAGNQFTLLAGTYRIYASAPAYAVAIHKTKLRNITDGSDEIIGTSNHNDPGDADVSRSLIIGVFTITSSKAFEIQHRSIATRADGFGVPSNLGVIEVYTDVQLWKVA